MDVVDVIADVQTTGSERSTPTERITIDSVTIDEK
jgi:hypothetical protein